MTEVQAELDRARLEDGTAVITPEMAFRDCIAEWRASQAATACDSRSASGLPCVREHGHPGACRSPVHETRDGQRFTRHWPRATPARALRLRLCLDEHGPHWLTLLCHCAWLRGVVGET